MPPSKDEVSSKLSKLDLQKETPGKKSKAKEEEVADSWEDEDVSDTDDGPTTPKASAAAEAPAAPPPTPASPADLGPPEDWCNPDKWAVSSSSSREGRRPEKTDAVARRLIAAGLGMKAPKQTDEQRAYQKSVREQERKRRDQEKAEQQQRVEASEKAKAAMWDD
ncbi:hypothetical protein NLG97_g9566 [Lecanicillium saksenae]|uniref:Uncharacterized protein n=1 Tax=Lecanicillium saksenae TaxID=468837 RepID=A0ACC1QGY2_9HYPO|nr:hypothetical protein NLG97_g9566 [Lecanicillium saksenae]